MEYNIETLYHAEKPQKVPQLCVIPILSGSVKLFNQSKSLDVKRPLAWLLTAYKLNPSFQVEV